MQIVSMIWGILALVGMFIAFLPCLGSLNWLNIPFSAVGLIVSIVTLTTDSKTENKSGSITGIVCCAIAIGLGFIRLVAGGGLL